MKPAWKDAVKEIVDKSNNKISILNKDTGEKMELKDTTSLDVGTEL